MGMRKIKSKYFRLKEWHIYGFFVLFWYGIYATRFSGKEEILKVHGKNLKSNRPIKIILH